MLLSEQTKNVSGIAPKILINFFTFIKSILNACLTAWSWSYSAHEREPFQREVRSANHQQPTAHCTGHLSGTQGKSQQNHYRQPSSNSQIVAPVILWQALQEYQGSHLQTERQFLPLGHLATQVTWHQSFGHHIHYVNSVTRTAQPIALSPTCMCITDIECRNVFIYIYLYIYLLFINNISLF